MQKSGQDTQTPHTSLPMKTPASFSAGMRLEKKIKGFTGSPGLTCQPLLPRGSLRRAWPECPGPGGGCRTLAAPAAPAPPHAPCHYKSFAESDLNQAWKFLWHEPSRGFQTTYSFFITTPVLFYLSLSLCILIFGGQGVCCFPSLRVWSGPRPEAAQHPGAAPLPC